MSDSVFVFLASAMAAAGETTGGTGTRPQSPIPMWLPLVGFIAIMWFLLIRPNQKREKERRDMLASLSKGDEVVTTGGIHGAIVGLNEKTVVLRVSDDPAVKIEFARGAVSRVNRKDDKNDD